MTPAEQSNVDYNLGYADARAGKPLQGVKSRGYECGHATGTKHAATGLLDPAVADEVRHVLYLLETEGQAGAQGYLKVVGDRRGEEAKANLRTLALSAWESSQGRKAA